MQSFLRHWQKDFPLEFKAHLYFSTYSFPKGQLFFASSEKGLVWAYYIRPNEEISEIIKKFREKSIALKEDPNRLIKTIKLFDRYFGGEKEDFSSLALDFIFGTKYQQKVWSETRKVPHGQTASYKTIAEKLGNKGYRSIGQALNKNPIIIAVPCHRIISADSSIGGFGAGLDLKRYLLSLENPQLTI